MPASEIGRYIRTVSGRRYYPAAPDVEDIDLYDIAHSLSNLCRFNGHCATFYSVAEHSVHVSRFCLPADALWGLLHDASEAYLHDIPRPVLLLPGFERYRELDAMAQRTICEKFGLPPTKPASVQIADDDMLATEAVAITLIQPWELGPARGKQLSVGSRLGVTPSVARTMFLSRFADLQNRT